MMIFEHVFKEYELTQNPRHMLILSHSNNPTSFLGSYHANFSQNFLPNIRYILSKTQNLSKFWDASSVGMETSLFYDLTDWYPRGHINFHLAQMLGYIRH